MDYHMSVKINMPFDQALEMVKSEVTAEGMGILTEIDIKAKLMEKLGVDFSNYVILGVCHPPSAYQALQAEPQIGVMLPCNVIIREIENGEIEVAAVDPETTMQFIGNEELSETAGHVKMRLCNILERIAAV